MKRLIFSSLIWLGILWAAAVPASAAPDKALELSVIIQKALQANPELKALESELGMNRAQIGPAGSLDDPMLGVELMNVPTDSLRLNESEMSGVQISLAQKLPFPGKLEAQREIAALRSQTLEHRIEQLKLNIAWNIKRIYYELYLKSRKKNILENQRAFLRQTLKTSRDRYALNQVSQASILNLQVEEAQLVNEQLRLSSEMKDLEAELAHISGHAEHASQISFAALKIKALDLKEWNDDIVVQRVIAQNAELRALQTDVKVSDATLDLAKKSYLPDFELMASYTLRDKIPGMETANNGQDLVGARIGISLPLWGATRQSEQIKEAVAGRDRSTHAFDNARLMQIHQARALLAELKESQQRINLFESGLLQLSQQAVGAAQSAYLTGKESYASLLEALKKQQDTEYGYQEALVAWELQIAKLEALIGQNLGKQPNE
jgi:outer membrane protein TolC